MPEFYIGRQPIFDVNLRVMGYELLYRPHDGTRAGVIDGDQATSQVILNSFMEIGLQKLVGPHYAFINLTRNFILNSDLLPSEKDQVVLEVLENIDVDEPLVQGIRALAAKGYRIALDDFVFHDNLCPLVEIADIIKIDLRALDPPTLEEHVKILSEYPVKLLAEKVETHEELELCRQLGFEYFQGYFLCCPRTIKGRRLPGNRINTLRLMAKLQDPANSLSDLESIIAQDVTLSYKLLRYINSAAFLGRKEINSIRHAIVYLGTKTIKNWATLIALAAIDDKPSELITTALIRGRMCESLAESLGKEDTQSAFTVGMFSVLDALLDRPLQALIEELPFSIQIREALLHHQGPYGQILQSTIAYDRGDWEHINCCDQVEERKISDIYLGALQWAEETMSNVAAA
jgi:EAL and modified HD-GYP domain-containing signal transduction protein